MDDSDMEILGITLDSGRKESKQTTETVPQSSKPSKKSVKEKLKETENFHHHTAASKSSHSRKKRRKSHAERNNKKSRHEKANTSSKSECQRHLKYAQDMALSNKMEYPMMSDPHKPVPLITQSRITTSLGIYNKAKKSDKILRDLKIPDAVKVKTQESLQKILDMSEANLAPVPNLDSPLMLDDMGIGLVQVVQPSSPEARIPALKPVTIISAPKPVAVMPSHMDQNKGLSTHGERTLDRDSIHSRNPIPLSVHSSPELSPVSEAAAMMQSSFSLNSVFPGRDHFSEIKDSLLKQLHRQRQSSALKTPRKSHIPTRRHSSVRKNLNMEFERKSAGLPLFSGNVQSSRMSIERNLKQGDVVRRSDLIPKLRSPSRLGEPAKPCVTRGSSSSSSSSLHKSNAPHTITAPPSSTMTRVNAFEECARTLQDQPTLDISVEEFFPRVETQMLSGEHTVDMLDYIQLSCSSNNDSFSYPDPRHMVGNIVPVSALIYPPHLDPTIPFQEAERYCIPARKHNQHGMIVLQKGKYQPYVSGSDEDSPAYTLPLPPPPALPPSSPSPPQMFRQRMY